MIGVAPIPDLGVDLLLRLGVGRLALELVEKIRILIDLRLELIAIDDELRSTSSAASLLTKLMPPPNRP